jgi:hypothetical protein
MSTRRPPHPNAITLTVSALLGLGMLAGCTSGGSGSAPPKASATRSSGAPAGRATPAASAPRSPGAPAGTTPAGTSPASLSPAGLLSAARAALTAGGSVHVDITVKDSGGLVAFSDDATASGGRQVITTGTGRATILLIDGVDYVQADAGALEGFFHTSLQLASQAAGQWISLRPGDTLGSNTYDDVTAGITLSSVAQELQFAGQLTKAAPATVAGQPVIGVQAPLPADDSLPGAKTVLYVTDNSAVRPVRYELVGGGSTANELSFSQWGEKLILTRPAHAIPASSFTSAPVLT